MAGNHDWVFRALRFFTKDEVKTPLSFLFKVVPYLVGALIVILYAPISDDLKKTLVEWAFIALLGLAGIVMLFAWSRPKNLVYGESGHRTEHKFEFGTESRGFLREEIDVFPKGTDPAQRLIEEKRK